MRRDNMRMQVPASGPNTSIPLLTVTVLPAQICLWEPSVANSPDLMLASVGYTGLGMSMVWWKHRVRHREKSLELAAR